MTRERNRGRNPERGTWLRRRRCRFLLLFIPSLLFSLHDHLILLSFLSLVSLRMMQKVYFSWRILKEGVHALLIWLLSSSTSSLTRNGRREKKESLPSSSWQKNKKKITERTDRDASKEESSKKNNKNTDHQMPVSSSLGIMMKKTRWWRTCIDSSIVRRRRGLTTKPEHPLWVERFFFFFLSVYLCLCLQEEKTCNKKTVTEKHELPADCACLSITLFTEKKQREEGEVKVGSNFFFSLVQYSFAWFPCRSFFFPFTDINRSHEGLEYESSGREKRCKHLLPEWRRRWRKETSQEEKQRRDYEWVWKWNEREDLKDKPATNTKMRETPTLTTRRKLKIMSVETTTCIKKERTVTVNTGKNHAMIYNLSFEVPFEGED